MIEDRFDEKVFEFMMLDSDNELIIDLFTLVGLRSLLTLPRMFLELPNTL
jgi:hypothetical protein